MYVVFELGARWGANRPLIPLIAPGTNTDILGGPLAGINALSSNRPQLQQLISDLSQELGLTPEPPASFERHIDTIIKLNGTVLKETNTEREQISKKIPENQDETVQLVIWKMDESEYDKHGYSLEAIAQRAKIAIPKCQLILNSLIKKDYIELKRWVGAINGDRYLLKDGGSNYLLQKKLVE